MSFQKIKAVSAALLLAAGVAHVPRAIAQDDGIRAQLEQSGSTTTDEKRDFAVSAQAEMDRAVKQLAESMEDAEKDREAVRLNCLSKKLSSARTLSQVANAAGVAIEQCALGAETIADTQRQGCQNSHCNEKII